MRTEAEATKGMRIRSESSADDSRYSSVELRSDQGLMMRLPAPC